MKNVKLKRNKILFCILKSNLTNITELSNISGGNVTFKD